MLAEPVVTVAESAMETASWELVALVQAVAPLPGVRLAKGREDPVPASAVCCPSPPLVKAPQAILCHLQACLLFLCQLQEKKLPFVQLLNFSYYQQGYD